MGAERAEAQPDNGVDLAFGQDGSFDHTDLLGPPMEPEERTEETPYSAPRSVGRTVLGAFLILLALAWIGASGFAFSRSGVAPSLPTVISWTATASVPLALLGILWIIFGRTPRRETERFTRAVADMRKESTALESVLSIVAARLEENQARLTEEVRVEAVLAAAAH